MGHFDRQIATAQRLIARNGQQVIWRRLPDSLVDPDKPWRGPDVSPSPIDVTNVSIVFLPLDRVNTELVRYLPRTEVAIGSVYGLMGVVDFTPSIKDVVLRDGKELRITAIDVLAPNGQVILHTIQFDV